MTKSLRVLGKKIKDGNLLSAIVSCLFAITIAVALIVVCFFAIDYRYNWHTEITKMLLPNWLLLLMGVAGLSAIFWMTRKLFSSKIQHSRKSTAILLILSTAALLVQILIISQYYIKPQWDAIGNVVAAKRLAEEGRIPTAHPGTTLRDYAIYPNNSLRTIIYAGLIKFYYSIGGHDELLVLITFQCILCQLTGLLVFGIIRRVTKKEWLAWLTWLLFEIFVGLQPWFSIPYSDGTGIIFPTLMLYLFALRPKQYGWRYDKWMLIVISCYVGFKIKPQTAIIGIAIIIYQLYTILFNKITRHKPIFTGYRLKVVAMCVLAGCAIVVPVKLICDKYTPIIDKNLTMPLTHYLMMGMNWDSRGEYSTEDYYLTQGVYGTSDKKTKNLEVTKERIQDMGLGGFVNLMRVKLYANYRDGLFSWGVETASHNTNKQNNSVAKFFQSMYYTKNIRQDDRGAAIFQTIMQAIWLGVLAMGLFAVMSGKNRSVSVAMLAIIGLTIYELLFEARARYLFTYLPIYLILAVVGLCNVNAKIGRVMNKLGKNKAVIKLKHEKA